LQRVSSPVLGASARLDRVWKTDRYEDRFAVISTAWLTKEPFKVRVTTANGSFGLDGPGLQPACVDLAAGEQVLEAKLTPTRKLASRGIHGCRMLTRRPQVS